MWLHLDDPTLNMFPALASSLQTLAGIQPRLAAMGCDTYPRIHDTRTQYTYTHCSIRLSRFAAITMYGWHIITVVVRLERCLGHLLFEAAHTPASPPVCPPHPGSPVLHNTSKPPVQKHPQRASDRCPQNVTPGTRGIMPQALDHIMSCDLRLCCRYDVGGKVTFQLGCYPGAGARYVRHRDASASCPTRRATAICYLNPTWDPLVRPPTLSSVELCVLWLHERAGNTLLPRQIFRSHVLALNC
jgi:hypothetical protein